MPRSASFGIDHDRPGSPTELLAAFTEVTEPMPIRTVIAIATMDLDFIVLISFYIQMGILERWL
jgi:hypothetical protein